MNYYTNTVYCILLLTVSLIFHISSSFADVQGVGGPAITANLDAFNGSHVFEKIIFDSVSYPLLRRNEKGVELLLVEGLKVKGDTWVIKLKDGASFSNRNSINLIDVIWSFERCKSAGAFSNVTFIGKDRMLTLKTGKPVSYEKMIEDISQCHVLEEKSTEVFGRDAGKGSNLISSGNYQISDFKQGKNVILKLLREEAGVKKIEEVELRGIGNAEDGLSQLRAGSLLIFFTEDSEVLKKVETDPTLRKGSCQNYTYAARADSKYDCKLTFDLSLLRQ